MAISLILLVIPVFPYGVTGRSGKNTHISRISNSVTHLRSYTKTTIDDIAGNSATGAYMAAPIADITVLSAGITAQSAGITTLRANVTAWIGDSLSVS